MISCTRFRIRAAVSSLNPAVLHVISLVQYAMVTARGWAANSINARVRPSEECNPTRNAGQEGIPASSEKPLGMAEAKEIRSQDGI